MTVNYGSLPFQEQITFFRQKVNLPTRSWTDLWEGMHTRAFVVAGAMKEDLLTDLRGAVDKAVSEGITLEQFRKDFDQLVAKHGWAYNGGRNWRSRVIYDTNLRTSYQAGRYQQMQAVKATRPYWRYRHNDAVTHPRLEHQAWDGLVLSADDPFWSTHFPPNGWGCQCFVQSLSERDLKKLGKDGPDEAPPLDMETVTVGQRGPSPRTVNVPKGIDPGFGYNAGEAAWGRQLSQDSMDAWKAKGKDAWELLTQAGPETYGRPDMIPMDKTDVPLSSPLHDQAEVASVLRTLLGGEEKVFRPGNALPVLVNAESLAAHIDPRRAEYLPLLDELMSDPFEVWVAFERHIGSGRVVLRSRIIKALKVGKREGLLLVANASRGMLEGWTFVPASRLSYLQNQRRGILIYGRE